MHDQRVGAPVGRATERLERGVDGEGDAADLAAVPRHLEAVAAAVDRGHGGEVEEIGEPAVQFLQRHRVTPVREGYPVCPGTGNLAPFRVYSYQ